MAGIFKAYDIRGTVPDQLNPGIAHLIGRAMGEWLGQGEVLVSHDMRTHSPELSEAVIKGLTEAGCDVRFIGLASTPMNYWANAYFGVDASVSVTASHNAGQYNGFKISREQARPVGYDTGIGQIEEMVERWQKEGTPPAAGKKGAVRNEEGALHDYLDAMDQHLVAITRPITIAVDCANGMGGHFIRAFFDRHPELHAVPLFWELDGTFPNHEADPLKPKNLVPVQKAVRTHNCDFGAAFDGDADRCMFVDEKGEAVPSDLMIGVLAEDVLKNHAGAPILYDIRSSRAVSERIGELGGEPVRGKVGHAFMKALMREKGALFGGELSGHYYFAECSNTDSGLMALISVINRMEREGGKLSEHVAPLRRYHATGEINYTVGSQDRIAAILDAIESEYTGQGGKPDRLDGLTIDFEDWWFSLRASNTEPLLRLNLEANTPELRDQKRDEVAGAIQRLSG